MVVPVRVFDDDLDLRVDGPRRPHHQVPPGIVHLGQPEFRPGAVALRGDIAIGFAVREEEVIEDELVEVPGGELDNVFELLPVLGVRVAIRFELVGLADRHRDAAGDLDALAQEELLGLVQGRRVHHHHVARRLQIDLVHLHVLGHGFPVALQPRGVVHLPRLINTAVEGDVEILVVVSAGKGGDKAEQRETNQAEQSSRDAFHERILDCYCSRDGQQRRRLRAAGLRRRTSFGF